MPTLEDAAALALALPGVTEGVRYGKSAWFVGKACFAWERPLTQADLERWGEALAPEGPLVGLSTADLGEKEAILAEGRPGVFTITHFDGYPAVLVALSAVGRKDLKELITDAWLSVAPAELTADRLQP
ncbi:MAG: hypothetical protein JWM40_2259 [Frankiales bacterium]|nr:hypothetical protein [Frankiales bacterium]